MQQATDNDSEKENTCGESVKNNLFKDLLFAIYSFLVTKHVRKSFFAAVAIGMVGTTLLMQHAHYINFKKHLVDLPLLMKFDHFLAEKQYKCLKEESFQNSQDVMTLCLENDFWPANHLKEKCLVYSFTRKIEFGFERRLALDKKCTVHIFRPGSRNSSKNTVNLSGKKIAKLSPDESVKGRNDRNSATNSNPKFHSIGIFHRNDSQFGPRNWNMLTLGSIRDILNNSQRILFFLILDIDGLYRNGYAERILEEVLKSGYFRCISQMQITFRLNGRISDHFVELKRIRGILSIMTRYYSVGYRTYSVTNNLRAGKDLMATLMFAPLPVTWRAAYVNMRLGLC